MTVEFTVCPVCKALVPRRSRRGHVRRFCSLECSKLWHDRHRGRRQEVRDA